MNGLLPSHLLRLRFLNIVRNDEDYSMDYSFIRVKSPQISQKLRKPPNTPAKKYACQWHGRAPHGFHGNSSA